MATREDLPAITLRDHFAAGVSRHGDIVRAAHMLGKTGAWGRLQFAAICAELDVPVNGWDETQTGRLLPAAPPSDQACAA